MTLTSTLALLVTLVNHISMYNKSASLGSCIKYTNMLCGKEEVRLTDNELQHELSLHHLVIGSTC